MAHEESHENHSIEITRDDLFKPFKEPWHTKYVYPFLGAIFDKPVTFFREQIVAKVQKKPYTYYHERYVRVPDIDVCQVGDNVCILEANSQFYRDRLVDTNIVRILRQKRDECLRWYDRDFEDTNRFCKKYMDDHDEAATNFFIKYGELFFWTDVREAFMKQKHRMLWEREHGAVGTNISKASDGDKETDNAIGYLRKFHAHINLPKEMKV